ncbi:MAG TPA: histidine phosphatase family protein [Firmicutes bacterium]|nr:histidine phosphatase family protein [Bacillota bacterium]
MTRLIFVRHGETIWNQEMRYQGQEDSPLSELGLEQAKRTGEFLAGRKIDAAYSSDLKRALLTAKEISRHHNLKPKTDPRLREIAFGLWEGLTRTEVQENYGELYRARQKDSLHTRIPGAELPGEVVVRFQAALRDFVSRHQGQTVLVVGHGGCFRWNIASLLHIPLEKSHCIRLFNTGISEFFYRGENEECPWQVITLNSTAHLA